MFMTVKQAAEKWGVSDRRIRILCAEGKIPGAEQQGRAWKIPADAVKPADGRFKSKESLLQAIEGNTLTLRETDMVLRGLTIARKPLKDHMEAVGHKEAFDFVCELVKDRAPLTESIIRQIHSLALADKKEDRGVFKFTDRLAYYDAFDAFHVKHDLSAMEKLFARYVSERLDAYLAMLEES